MSEQQDVSAQPLVIVRRRRNHEEAHHGGVWKIAYADFMTAMMAFFLVMWLVNAADKKTIVQVAAYFNPMRLTDRYAAPKGLDDLSESETKQVEKKSKRGYEKSSVDMQKLDSEHQTKDDIGEGLDQFAKKSQTSAGGKANEVLKEQTLFDNPGDVLEKLAEQAKQRQDTGGMSSSGNISDPFDRINRKAGKSQTPGKPTPQSATSQPDQQKAELAGDKASQAGLRDDAKARPPAELNGDPSWRRDQSAAPLPEPKVEEPKTKLAEATPAEKEVLAKTIAADISEAVSAISRQMPDIEVKVVQEGLLISLTDDAKFGMFEIGSAKPNPELVLIMDKIGDRVKKLDGRIVVRGHTDSRTYRSAVYDNWRLSAARAQMAYFMLTRAGIPEDRFLAIEGRADKDPKVPSDTEAAENRRIDILIKDERH